MEFAVNCPGISGLITPTENKLFGRSFFMFNFTGG
jgi:hypothetical protein